MIEQPPTVAAPNLFYGRLQDIAGSAGTLAPPTVAAFDYEAKIPTVYAFNAGIQIQLPWTSALDVSYVGSKSRNLNTQVNINAPTYGVAYRPENQDPTIGACPTRKRLRGRQQRSWCERAAGRLSAALSRLRRHHSDTADGVRRLPLAADILEPPFHETGCPLA